MTLPELLRYIALLSFFDTQLLYRVPRAKPTSLLLEQFLLIPFPTRVLAVPACRTWRPFARTDCAAVVPSRPRTTQVTPPVSKATAGILALSAPQFLAIVACIADSVAALPSSPAHSVLCRLRRHPRTTPYAARLVAALQHIFIERGHADHGGARFIPSRSIHFPNPAQPPYSGRRPVPLSGLGRECSGVVQYSWRGATSVVAPSSRGIKHPESSS